MSGADFEASIGKVDGDLYGLMVREQGRQRAGLEMIASENFVPRAILEAQGSILTNKYAEGYPHKKYYGGCEFVEEIEDLAIRRAKELFGAEHANVQPHSGTTANMAVYFAVMKPGDTMLAMKLDQGGHLSHGHPLNFTGLIYNVVGYGVRPDTETIDYDQVRQLALEHRPRVIVAGASAYPRFIDFEAFARIAQEVGAVLMVDMAHIAGLVAGGVHPSPVPHADFVTTTTHKTLRGPRGALVLCRSQYAAQLDRTVFPGIQGGPLVHVMAGKAVCFHLAMREDFKEYARNVVLNAKALAEALMDRGFRLVSGGTDNHLLLVDLRSKGITGKEAEVLLDRIGIACNKNMIPFDPEKPMVASGIRLGTAALTTRGLGPVEMRTIAEIIDRAIALRDNHQELERLAGQVREMSLAFPLYTSMREPWVEAR
ncbi:Glycine hydroxymethyltransferase [Thermanaerovibrio acidaminovorans DSM 6589]|uniref:Serine hydroxymethyltransferase n=1 Tax=Thermanaerovibrio acidaminovorans (strain ATCC 49978 / DSM 6589 / Su883) TaxID=525903 RepID=D1B6H9_THEAS|nr:serine hydroxymethyltransferase [Thermanaerovibrio acidaminovorans]ACZ19620.1 Glycine hydroxymethyltransferase [Thermanaerovibrio acidaminovorans DSM 6589]